MANIDIEFTVSSAEQHEGVIDFLLYAPSLDEPFCMVTMDCARVANMPSEQLEYLLYKTVLSKYKSQLASSTNMDSKIKDVKTSISAYNEKIKSKTDG